MYSVDVRDYILTVVTALLAGIGFLIRKILTSEAKINLLEQALNDLQQERKDHDDKVDEMLTELRVDIKNLLSRPSN